MDGKRSWDKPHDIPAFSHRQVASMITSTKAVDRAVPNYCLAIDLRLISVARPGSETFAGFTVEMKPAKTAQPIRLVGVGRLSIVGK